MLALWGPPLGVRGDAHTELWVLSGLARTSLALTQSSNLQRFGLQIQHSSARSSQGRSGKSVGCGESLAVGQAPASTVAALERPSLVLEAGHSPRVAVQPAGPVCLKRV